MFKRDKAGGRHVLKKEDERTAGLRGPGLPSYNDVDGWRDAFVDFYRRNAPGKIDLVNDALMAQWAGRYDELWGRLQAKYGPHGAAFVGERRR